MAPKPSTLLSNASSSKQNCVSISNSSKHLYSHVTDSKLDITHSKVSDFRSIVFRESDEEDFVESSENGSNTTRSHRGNKQSTSATTDVSSLSSIYLMLTDGRYYFQHPTFRVVIVIVVMVLNVISYAQNPSSHSYHIVELPFFGEIFNMICRKYPKGAFFALKLGFWVIAIIIGYVLGKYFIHRFICNYCLRLKMFAKGQGRAFFILLCAALCIFSFTQIYNEIMSQYKMKEYIVDNELTMTYDIYAKLFTCLLFFGNFITMVLIADVIIYSKLYPNFCMKSRSWMRRNANRAIVFWILFVGPITIFTIIIFVDHEDRWDRLYLDQSFNDEMWNLCVITLALMLNLLSVMQDWDFPHFKTRHDYTMPGVDQDHLNCLSFVKYCNLETQGKTFNYAVILFVIILDIQGCVSQFYYVPEQYGQYADPNGVIYSINDKYTLDNYLNLTLLSFEFRSTHNDSNTGALYIYGDTQLSSRYAGYENGTKALILVPVGIVYIIFSIITYWFGTYDKPTDENKYVGRLFKVDTSKSIDVQQRMSYLDIAMKHKVHL